MSLEDYSKFPPEILYAQAISQAEAEFLDFQKHSMYNIQYLKNVDTQELVIKYVYVYAKQLPASLLEKIDTSKIKINPNNIGILRYSPLSLESWELVGFEIDMNPAGAIRFDLEGKYLDRYVLSAWDTFIREGNSVLYYHFADSDFSDLRNKIPFLTNPFVTESIFNDFQQVAKTLRANTPDTLNNYISEYGVAFKSPNTYSFYFICTDSSRDSQSKDIFVPDVHPLETQRIFERKKGNIVDVTEEQMTESS